MKEEQKLLTVTTDKNLYQAFKKTAKANDKSMSVLIRDFMRDYVSKHGQGVLFK